MGTFCEFLIGLAALLAEPGNAPAQQDAAFIGRLFISDGDRGLRGAVGEYDYSTGQLIKLDFIRDLFEPQGLAVSGNDLFVISTDLFAHNFDYSGIVGKYDARTGRRVNAKFITGLRKPDSAAVSGSRLFVNTSLSRDDKTQVVSEYDSATGKLINANFITGLKQPDGMAVQGNTLYVSDTQTGKVGTYVVDTGGAINPDFITRLDAPRGLAVVGNTLYVLCRSRGDGAIEKYDATTGRAIDLGLVTGLHEFTVALAAVHIGASRTEDLLFPVGPFIHRVTIYDSVDGQVVWRNFITGLHDGALGIVYWSGRRD